jgi:thioredoxin 1
VTRDKKNLEKQKRKRKRKKRSNQKEKMSEAPGTPQFVGSAPKMFSGRGGGGGGSYYDIGDGGDKNKSVKVVLLAVLSLGAVVLLIFIVKKYGKSNKTPSPSPAASTTSSPSAASGIIVNPNSQPHPRNIPSYPVNAPQPLQYKGLNGTSSTQFSSYQSNEQPQGPPQNAGNYHQKANEAYSDNQMAAYSNYAQAVGAQGKLQQWDEATFNKLVMQQKSPALVAFVMNGCGPCGALKPQFEEAAKHAKITFALVERGGAGGLLNKYQIGGFPTVLLFRGGEMVKQYSGDRSMESLVKFSE